MWRKSSSESRAKRRGVFSRRNSRTAPPSLHGHGEHHNDHTNCSGRHDRGKHRPLGSRPQFFANTQPLRGSGIKCRPHRRRLNRRQDPFQLNLILPRSNYHHFQRDSVQYFHVRPGRTLRGIAERHGNRYRQLRRRQPAGSRRTSLLSRRLNHQYDEPRLRRAMERQHPIVADGELANRRLLGKPCAAVPLAHDDGLNFLRINHPASFNIQYWEVGNEVYGSWEADEHGGTGDSLPMPAGETPKAHDPATLISFAKQFATLASQIAPGILIGYDSQAVDGSYNNWIAATLQQCASQGFTPGFIADHYYTSVSPGSENDATLLGISNTPTSGNTYDWSQRRRLRQPDKRISRLRRQKRPVNRRRSKLHPRRPRQTNHQSRERPFHRRRHRQRPGIDGFKRPARLSRLLDLGSARQRIQRQRRLQPLWLAQPGRLRNHRQRNRLRPRRTLPRLLRPATGLKNIQLRRNAGLLQRRQRNRRRHLRRPRTQWPARPARGQ